MLRNGDGPDGAAARRHGRAAGGGGHRPALRQHGDAASTPTARTSRSMHACGHDMHVTWLIGAATLLADAPRRVAGHASCSSSSRPRSWAPGPQAMIDDGLFERFATPGRRARPARRARARPAGSLLPRRPDAWPPADSLEIAPVRPRRPRVDARASVDPVVMAAATVLRLQTIVSREVAADRDRGGHGRRAAGGHEGEHHPRRGRARAERPHLRRARCATGCSTRSPASSRPRPPPRARRSHRRSRRSTRYPLLSNDPDATAPRRRRASPTTSAPTASCEGAAGLRQRGLRHLRHRVAAFPSVFWFVGGTDPETFCKALAAGRVDEDIPTNHSPRFAPVQDPTSRPASRP